MQTVLITARVTQLRPEHNRSPCLKNQLCCHLSVLFRIHVTENSIYTWLFRIHVTENSMYTWLFGIHVTENSMYTWLFRIHVTENSIYTWLFRIHVTENSIYTWLFRIHVTENSIYTWLFRIHVTENSLYTWLFRIHVTENSIYTWLFTSLIALFTITYFHVGKFQTRGCGTWNERRSCSVTHSARLVVRYENCSLVECWRRWVCLLWRAVYAGKSLRVSY
jgi:hypothetical protein